MTATPDPNAAEAARLRAAHELLDERPSPGVRTAVLRAAAESVRGSPSTDPVRVARPVRWWLGWQPAAAATVAVGILAVGLSVHVEHERPTASRSETSAPPATAAPIASPETNAETFSKAREAKPAVTPPPSAPRPPIPQDASRAAKRDFDQPAAARSAEAGAGAVRTDGSFAAGSSGSPSGSPEAVPSAESNARMMAAPAAAPPARGAAPAAKALLQKQAEPLQPTTDADRLQRSASPDDWLHRIIQLRRAGRDAQADDELARFRAAFPNAKIPADALK